MKSEVGSSALALSQGINSKIRFSIKAAHGRLGHCDEECNRAIARLLNWSIVRGTLPPSRDFVTGIASRQQNVPKDESSHMITSECMEGYILTY